MDQHVEIFPWNPNFETGIDILDSQHRGLVDLLNTLVSHLAYQSDAPTINQVFADLKHYSEVHFATEDEIWRADLGEDAWVVQHRGEHEEFIARLAQLRLEEDGQHSFDEIVEDVVGFLSRWLALHIIESDKRVARAVLGVRSGLDVAAAKERADAEMSGSLRVVIDTVMAMYDALASRAMQLTREISRRLRAEAELKAANEELVRLRNLAIEANRAKSAFLADMSHEIRSPLNAISGMTHLLRRDGLTPLQVERTDKLDGAVTHLIAIVDAILDLAKIEAGKMELESGPVEPGTIVADVAGMLQGQAEAKGLRVETAIDPIPGPLVGDVTRLRQALLNYASNAIKFTVSGSVTLRVGVADDDGEGVLLRFEVEDTGIGMPPETFERLFAPFEQADRSVARRHGGSGLGLAITRRLAELMGGSAGGRSSPGHGSLFWFTARLMRGRRDEAGAAPESGGSAAEILRRSFAGARVLVVDDEPVNREVGMLLLEDAGLAVDVASDGFEAIARLDAGNLRLILMDMQMPEMDGIETTARIRNLPTGAAIPIVALSANAFAEDRRRCLEAGMDDFLVKPVDPDLLYGIVLHWLRQGHRSTGR